MFSGGWRVGITNLYLYNRKMLFFKETRINKG